jgi:hypothetical protein
MSALLAVLAAAALAAQDAERTAQKCEDAVKNRVASPSGALEPVMNEVTYHRNPKLDGRKVCYYCDDVIWLYRDLARQRPKSLFDNPFLKNLKEAHGRYGLKVQLNSFWRTDFFYGMDEFTLAEMPDTWKKEWRENRDWPGIGLHSPPEVSD